MKTLIARLGIVIFLVAFPAGCFAIDAWPGGAGTTIATYLDASGAVWHEGRQSLFIVQNSGTLVEIGADGTFKHSWSVPGDLEGITLAENDSYLYIGIEYPERIIEFSLETGELTGKSWNLSSWMNGTASDGLEGLAFRNGYFLAGEQLDGKIYIFNVNLNTSGVVSHISTITPEASYTDISGIEYNSNTGITYAIFDTDDALIELNSSNAVVNHFTLPGTTQEGITLVTNCSAHIADVYVTNDGNGQVIKYPNYPISCIDADSDGVFIDEDCNDYDASISENQTYYRDADGDGLGSNTTISVCLYTPPAGYVTNSNDSNDSDYDNDGSSIGSDCNDADSSISQNQTYYRDIDNDGWGDANTTTQICSYAAPGGYVTNTSDPADISSNGRWFSVNGGSYDFFTLDPTTVEYTDLNFYDDGWQEIIAVGLVTKKAYVTLARVSGSDVTVTKRRMVRIKKKHKAVQIVPNLTKKKFTTRFSRGKKYTWKVTGSGSFKRSR